MISLSPLQSEKPDEKFCHQENEKKNFCISSTKIGCFIREKLMIKNCNGLHKDRIQNTLKNSVFEIQFGHFPPYIYHEISSSLHYDALWAQFLKFKNLAGQFVKLWKTF